MNLSLKKYIMGGLAAGVVVFLSGITLAHFVLAGDFPVPDIPADMLVSAFVVHTALRLIVGFGAFTIYLLAARAGVPRVRPMMAAVLIVWLVAYTPGLALLMDYTDISFASLLIIEVWSLVEVALAIAAGRWVAKA